ncbi:hypothetical protein H5410_051244 [Solanum commersonii]|uniref:Uncharacterized protein n=1 Tax=Solanum commersonii TaxID=4109 RepID=A0A9J5WXN6_SOLCO|nr:hypothetical protein H5410_051244 [Solanum commersonii]
MLGNLGLTLLKYEILIFFIQPDQNICLRIVKCYYTANVLDVFVLNLPHLEDHLDYTALNVNVLPLSKELFMQRRDEAKHLTEDWEGAVADLKEAAEKSPQDRNIRKVLMRAERSLKLSQRKD